MTELTQARTAPDRARSITDAATYGQAALEAEARAVANAPYGQRNRTLNRAAFKLGQLAATRALTEQIITEQLSTAAADCGLPHPEARRTITSGLRAGIRTPRHQWSQPIVETLEF